MSQYKCPKCQKIYDNEDDLKAHLNKQKHVSFNVGTFTPIDEDELDEEQDEQPPEEPTKKFDLSSLPYSTILLMNIRNKNFTCPRCGDKFGSQFELFVHVDAIHVATDADIKSL